MRTNIRSGLQARFSFIGARRSGQAYDEAQIVRDYGSLQAYEEEQRRCAVYDAEVRARRLSFVLPRH